MALSPIHWVSTMATKPTIDLTTLPAQAPGLGSIFSNTAAAIVGAAQLAQTATAMANNFAAAGEQISLIALDKATNMRETCTIQDAMILAVLRAQQQQQLEQLQAKGLEVRSDLFAD
jgi:hypothetical protein